MKTFLLMLACALMVFAAPKAKVSCKQGVPDQAHYYCTVTLSEAPLVDMAFYTKDLQVAIPAGRTTFGVTAPARLKHWKLVEHSKYVSMKATEKK